MDLAVLFGNLTLCAPNDVYICVIEPGGLELNLRDQFGASIWISNFLAIHKQHCYDIYDTVNIKFLTKHSIALCNHIFGL